jgi:hypothetical protein
MGLTHLRDGNHSFDSDLASHPDPAFVNVALRASSPRRSSLSDQLTGGLLASGSSAPQRGPPALKHGVYTPRVLCDADEQADKIAAAINTASLGPWDLERLHGKVLSAMAVVSPGRESASPRRAEVVSPRRQYISFKAD